MGGEELRFTGNWFIDAGILGFVNLMEEVYGWDLEKLQERVKEEPEKVHYGYFPLAYFYSLSVKSDENRNTLLEAIKEIEGFEGDKHKLLELVWWKYITRLFKDEWIKKKLGIMHAKKTEDRRYNELIQKREYYLSQIACSDKCEGKLNSLLRLRESSCRNGKHNLKLKHIEILKDIPLENLPEECRKYLSEAIKIHRELESYLIPQWSSLTNILEKDAKNMLKDRSRYFRLPVDNTFFKNFMFFNNSKGILEQLADLTHLIDGDTEYSRYLQKIDRTLNKFLPSDNEFPNIAYTPLRIKSLTRNTPYLFVYLLSFLSAFTRVRGVGRVFFYGSTLEFTYTVNKRLKLLISQINDRKSLFKITWQAVIDSITESSAKWSLENMYLIQYSRMNPQTQSLVSVEYIGIPKFHASIILDDGIREAINTSLKVDPKNPILNAKNENVWVLEFFINQKPLYPLVMAYVWSALKGKNYVKWKTTLYALAIDAKLKANSTETSVFRKSFLERPKEAVAEIKEYYKDMMNATWNIGKISGSINGKNIVYPLFSAVRKHNRNAFVNILLRALLQAGDKNAVSRINSYIFRHILNNDTSWGNFALALVIGLAGGGADVGSTGESEEGES
ncbi:hypothetical protein [Palaeococcus ferrophilus]|uniref:hypothetical protein n=1 Tax=Palaeococcus ferrophilus TaxID=83868 RepID=UPI00064E5A57|nr:hypothetical protein [Palaeococcus ferrophilus]